VRSLPATLLVLVQGDAEAPEADLTQHATTVSMERLPPERAVRWVAHAAGERELTIEPGRSIIAPAGVALYRVGSVKKGARTYVAVDGGMADNMRPTAYGAEYTAALASRVDDGGLTDVAIAGKYCETGDILIQKVSMPLPRPGDLVAVPVAGAYHLSMASNYNMAPRPAVVVVADGGAKLVRRRETYDDLIAGDLSE